MVDVIIYSTDGATLSICKKAASRALQLGLVAGLRPVFQPLNNELLGVSLVTG
jgi:hypothetical protein